MPITFVWWVFSEKRVKINSLPLWNWECLGLTQAVLLVSDLPVEFQELGFVVSGIFAKNPPVVCWNCSLLV